MEILTAHERVSRMLKREKADRISLYEHFWNDTHAHYAQKGHVSENETLEDHFNLDIRKCWPFECIADINHGWVTLEETDETMLIKDGNGAIMRRHKKHNSTPEHVDFTVRDRESWEKVREMLIEPDERRINFEAYRKMRADAKAQNKFFCWAGINVFEQMHPICGHEYMLMGMIEDPDWVQDMIQVYSNMTINLQEILFEKEGPPDGIWFYEDMGFKERPFMSPNMYKELILPAHKRTIGFAHERKLPVIMHICGFVEPLLPGVVEAGIDCLQAIEIKAGMDLLRIYKDYGEKISLMGGLDVRVLCENDKAAIDRELESKIPIVKQNYGFCLHSDHSIPKTVEYETLKYFIEKGLDLGAY